jgi:hypothetical protein
MKAQRRLDIAGAAPITIPRQPSNPCLLLHKELYLRFPYHPFQTLRRNVGAQSVANLPIWPA